MNVVKTLLVRVRPARQLTKLRPGPAWELNVAYVSLG